VSAREISFSLFYVKINFDLYINLILALPFRELTEQKTYCNPLYFDACQ